MGPKTTRLARCVRVFALLCMTCYPALDSSALFDGHVGNEPFPGGGLPYGSDELADLPTRLGWIAGPSFGSGLFIFYYVCTSTEEFNEALETFSHIDAPKLELVVYDGAEFSWAMDSRIDWMFTVWSPAMWKRMTKREDSPPFLLGYPHPGDPVPAPRMDVFLADKGPIVWEAVRVPDNVSVVERRAEMALGKAVNGGAIEGTVKDMTLDTPIAGAEVRIVGVEGAQKGTVVRTGESDDQGSFLIEDIPEGQYGVDVAAAGYATRGAGGFENRGKTYREYQVELVRAGRLKGTVRESDGTPIAGAELAVFWTGGPDGRTYRYGSLVVSSATSDELGRFELGGLPTGSVWLSCTSPAHHQADFDKIYDVPSDNVAVIMDRKGTIHGKVAGAAGEPSEAPLYVHARTTGDRRGKPCGHSSPVDEGGDFEFLVPPGDYVLGVDSDPEFHAERCNQEKVHVEAGEKIEVDISYPASPLR